MPPPPPPSSLPVNSTKNSVFLIKTGKIMPSYTDLECSHCRKNFSRLTKEVFRQLKRGREEFFCSSTCAAIHNNLSRDSAHHPLKKICPTCKKEFQSHTGAKAATFCSRGCASRGSVTDHRREKAKEMGLKNIKNFEGIISFYRSRYRSKSEGKVAVLLESFGITFFYEPFGIAYINPSTTTRHFYIPDFYLPDFNLILEVKCRGGLNTLDTFNKQKASLREGLFFSLLSNGDINKENLKTLLLSHIDKEFSYDDIIERMEMNNSPFGNRLPPSLQDYMPKHQ
jgi:hypothetical protein